MVFVVNTAGDTFVLMILVMNLLINIYCYYATIIVLVISLPK
jgi:hypothetical protein